MVHRRSLVLVGAGVIALGTGCALLLSHTTRSTSVSQGVASDCLKGRSALLSKDAFGTPFAQVTESYRDRSQPPAFLNRDPVFDAAFAGEHFVGYVTEVAITGPDRPAEDAYSRSLNYKVGPLPLIPLSGVVVQHNPGVLEVYEWLTAFTSTGGAQLLVDGAKATQAPMFPTKNGVPLPQPIETKLPLPGGEDGIITHDTQVDSEQEATYAATVARGAYVLQLTVNAT